MTIILSHFLLFLFICYSNGLIFLKKINHLTNANNFYEISIIGLAVTILAAQIINFFYPLNNLLIYLNIILIIYFIIRNKKTFLNNLKISYVIFIPILIISILNIYGSKFSDDINHYHYGSILNTDNHNYIWGLSHLHNVYGTSSIWLIGHSYFNFEEYRLQDIHILNGIILFLITCLFASEIGLVNKKKNNYSIIIFSILIFILLKYTRLKEFGIDRPAFLFFYFLIYYYLKNFLYNKNIVKFNDFLILCLICFLIIFIKIIFLSILIIPFYLMVKYRKKLFKINFKSALIFFIGLSFFLKNILISGCLIFPIDFLCFESISWNNLKGVKEITIMMDTINKSWFLYSGDLTQSQYLNNFNWISTWINRNFTELLEFLITVILCILITISCFKKKKFLKKIENVKYKEFQLVLLLLILFSLAIFFQAPIIRMFHHILILIMVLFLFTLIKEKKIVLKNNLILFFLITAIFFNGYKNILRIKKEHFINDPLRAVSAYIWKPHEKKIDNFSYFQGWFGQSPIGNENLKGLSHKKKFIFDIIYKKKL